MHSLKVLAFTNLSQSGCSYFSNVFCEVRFSELSCTCHLHNQVVAEFGDIENWFDVIALYFGSCQPRAAQLYHGR